MVSLRDVRFILYFFVKLLGVKNVIYIVVPFIRSNYLITFAIEGVIYMLFVKVESASSDIIINFIWKLKLQLNKSIINIDSNKTFINCRRNCFHFDLAGIKWLLFVGYKLPLLLQSTPIASLFIHQLLFPSRFISINKEKTSASWS